MTDTLTKLRTKRRRIHAQLDKLEPLVAGYRAMLRYVNAAIREIDPELFPQPRRYRANPVFKRGELPRIAPAVLREVRKPLPIGVIAARALAVKECRTPTQRVFKMTRVRLQQLFGKLERRGVVYSVGKGNATRRRLKRRARRADAPSKVDGERLAVSGGGRFATRVLIIPDGDPRIPSDST